MRLAPGSTASSGSRAKILPPTRKTSVSALVFAHRCSGLLKHFETTDDTPLVLRIEALGQCGIDAAELAMQAADALVAGALFQRRADVRIGTGYIDESEK